jgi:DNA repair exonuclease SbcCD nuclease subunit
MIIFSDIHFKNYPEFASPWEDGCNTRLQSQLEALEYIFRSAEEYGSRALVFLGDFFDDWRSIYTPLHSKVINLLYRLLEQNDAKLWLLPGNHDMINKESTRITTLDAIVGHPNINVVREPSIVDIEEAKCGFIPYTNDYTWWMEQARYMADKEVSVLFSHVDVVGAEASIEGYTSAGGIDAKEMGKMFKWVFLGHYHMRQTLAPKVVYVGSPLQLRRVETGQTKGWYYFNPDSIGSSYAEAAMFKENKYSPKFFDIVADSSGLWAASYKQRHNSFYTIKCFAKQLTKVREYMDVAGNGYNNYIIQVREEKPIGKKTDELVPDDLVFTMPDTLNKSTALKIGQWITNADVII